MVYFPVAMPGTTKMLIAVEGETADEAKIWDIEWVAKDGESKFGKIYPKSYSFNQAEYINLKPSRLWSGGIGNTWYEPLWSFPWEIFQTNAANSPDSIFPPYKGPPAKSGVIIWELDGSYEVETLKAYFGASWRSLAFEFWDGSSWVGKQTFNGNANVGWNRIDIAKPVSATKIRITFPNGWEQARFINQIEVWGEGVSETPSRTLVLAPKDDQGAYQATITGLEKKTYQCEVAIKGYTDSALQVTLNGLSFSNKVFTKQGEDTVYRFKITADQLREDCQFLSLVAVSDVRGVILSEQNDTGFIDLGDHFSDGYINAPINSSISQSKERKWKLPRSYELEKIDIYATSVSSLCVKVGSGRKEKTVWATYDSLKGFWEADLQGADSNTITLSSETAFMANEVCLYGTPLADDQPYYELWWPAKGMSATSSGSDGNSVIGWMGDASMAPLVGGYHPRQADKIFWMPLNQLGLTEGEAKTFVITGTLGALTKNLTYSVRWPGKVKSATLDQGENFFATTSSTITISGTVPFANSRCFVQGVEVAVKNGRFTTETPLSEGYQLISVEVTDASKKRITTRFCKPVYRTIGNPDLRLDQPYGDIWSQSEELTVTGRVGNGYEMALTVNGTAVELINDSFSATVQLVEGTQPISFELTDSVGRKTTKTLTVFVDRTKPTISIVKPTEGQYIANSTFDFTVDASPDTKLWWQYNAKPWVYEAETTHTETYTRPDGFYAFTARAQDRSGNISDVQEVNFCVDVTPPESFAIGANVSGWTNNNAPTINFSTTDATSGVDYYEYTVDAGGWTMIASPFVLPVLSDGIHTVSVRAIDRAGNIRNEALVVKIDTSNPPNPTQVRPVPGTDNITMKWFGVDDGESFQTYRIERSPAWSDGVRAVTGEPYGKQSYCDKNLTLGDTYSYRIWAVDRAGNVSGKSDWKAAEVGLASIPVNDNGKTIVEYENMALIVPQGALATDIIKVQISEVPQTEIVKKPRNAMLGPVFRCTVVRQSGDETTVTNHADLSLPVTVELTFKQSKLPEKYTSVDAKPFYYDDIWGQWIAFSPAMLDTQTDTLRFTTKHFTDFSVQATKAEPISPQQVRDVEFSPFATKVGSSGVNVSDNGGSVSTSFTEQVLPGKNGLDLVLQRTYDTGTAQRDATARGDSKSGSDSNTEVEINGDTPWRIADGWRYNFPSIKVTGTGIWLTDLDGATTSIGQCTVAANGKDGNDVIVTMTSHESTDLKAILRFKESGFWIFASYSFNGGTVYMRDGREMIFDSLGRIVTIKDATRINSIAFSYNAANQVEKIVDSMGRTVTFTYQTVDSVNLIKTCLISNGNKSFKNSVVYTLTGSKLTSAIDVGGRSWSYAYKTIDLTSSCVLQSPPSGYIQAKDKIVSVSALSEVSGPGIGRIQISYTTTEMPYTKKVTGSDGTVYQYDINSIRLLALSKEIFLATSGIPERKSTYGFELKKHEGSGQYYTASSTQNDGRISTTTTFKDVLKKRTSLSQAPEALKESIGYTVSDREETTEVLNHIDTVKRTLVDNTPVDTENQTWDETHMRLTIRKVAKTTANYQQTTLQHDDWGNVKQQIEESYVGARVSKKVIDRVFYVDVTLSTINSILEENKVITSFLKNNPSYVSNVTLNVILSSLGNTRYNLLASSKTSISAYREDREISDTNPIATELANFELYTYTPLGQLSSKIKVANSTDCAVTDYTYDASNGQIASITEPVGSGSARQVTNYAYDYSLADEYTVKTTRVGVALVYNDTATNDLVSTQGFNKLTGTLSWSKDANEKKTSYTYDALGRVRIQVKPKISNDESTVAIEYDDTNITSTVTNELGATTKYVFDSLGRLAIVTKSNIDAGSDETITTKLTYDGYDQVTSIYGPYSSKETTTGRSLDNLKTSFEYDAQGRVVKTTQAGLYTSKVSVYDDTLNQVTVTDEDGKRTRQTFDWNGNILSTTAYKGQDSSNNEVWIGINTYYDGLGRPVARYDANRNKTDIKYNLLGLEDTTTLPSRDVVEFKEVKGVRPVTTKSYYLNGYLKSVSQETGTSITNTVNGLGWVLKTEQPAADDKTITVVYGYDSVGNKTNEHVGYTTDITSEWKENGKKWTYDAQGHVLTQSDENNAVTTFAYDAAGNRTTIIDPRDSNTNYTSEFSLTLGYDKINRLIKATLPRLITNDNNAELIIQMSYDGYGNLVERTEPDGRKTTNTYNIRNLLTEELVTGGNVSVSTKHEYSYGGKEKTTTYPTGRVIAKKYNNLNQLESETGSDEGETLYTYDDNGNVTSVTDPLRHKTLYSYDPDNQLLQTTDMKKNVYKNTYDRLGRLTSTSDPNNNLRTYSYDYASRLISETNPRGKAVTYDYDGRGNVVIFKDANGTTFTRRYAPTNKLSEETAINGALSEKTSYEYDEAGDIKSVTYGGVTTLFNHADGKDTYQPNPYGLTSEMKWNISAQNSLSMGYTYDNCQRLTDVSMPGGSKLSYTYDSLSRLTSISNWISGITYTSGSLLDTITYANTTSKTITYDIMDRPKGLSYKTVDSAATLASYSFTYDKASNLIIRSNDHGCTSQYSYDELNQLISANERNGLFQKKPDDIKKKCYTIDRDYTGAGEYTDPSVDENAVITFDMATRSIICDLGEDRSINKIDLLPIDSVNRVRPGDIRVFLKAASVSGSSTWIEETSRIIEKDAKTGVLSLCFPNHVNAQYVKIMSIWDDRDTTNLSIAEYASFKNNIQKLVQIWTLTTAHDEVYQYDAVGNRSSIAIDTNAMTLYQYYSNASKNNSPLVKYDGTWYYTYDANGNRTGKGKAINGSVTDETIIIDTNKEYWEYGWDLHNRLISVKSSTGVSVTYTYDGLNYRVKRVSKDETTLYAYGRQGALTYQKNLTTGFERTYSYLNNEIIGWTEKVNGVTATYYAITDNLGSVTDVLDKDKKSVWTSEYLPFGNVAGAEGSMHFGGMYTGKDYDVETGLTYHWNRWRSEDGSYFISEDPARDGMNWYGYCGNNPMTHQDPTGLYSDDPMTLAKVGSNDNASGNTVIPKEESSATRQESYCWWLDPKYIKPLEKVTSSEPPQKDEQPKQNEATKEKQGSDNQGETVSLKASSNDVLYAAICLTGSVGELSVASLAVLSLVAWKAQQNWVNEIFATQEANYLLAQSVRTKISELSKGRNRNDKTPGSYTIFFESGFKYHGKGPYKRAMTSAYERAVRTLPGNGAIDMPVLIQWEPAISNREAYKQEYIRIQDDGGPGLGILRNYNMIQSPGMFYYFFDNGHFY
jgi:RHS repeat-associated protein